MNGSTACHHFNSGFLCAESVLLAGAEALNIDNPAIPAMATAFCSGTARTKGTCGAFQGGVLLISLIHGRNTPDQDLDYCYTMVQTFTDWFEKQFCSINCHALTGCDFLDKNDSARFKQEGIKDQVCYPLVEKTTDYIILLLKEEI